MSVSELFESFRQWSQTETGKKKDVSMADEPLPASETPVIAQATTDFGSRLAAPRPVQNAIRMVALDMDGTMLNPRESITPRVHRAVYETVKRGIQVVIATARPPRSVRFYHRALKLETPIVSHNGALVWDERRQCVLRHASLDHSLVRRVIAFARRRCPEVIPSVEIIDRLYSDHFGIVPMDSLPPGRSFSPDVIASMEAFLRVPVTRLFLHGKPSVIDELNYLLPGRFHDRLNVIHSESRLLQIVAPDITKASALGFLADAYGFSSQQVMAIGDTANDLPMLQWAGMGVVMANAPEHVRNVVGNVVPSNAEDGVAVALEKYILNTD